MENSKDDVITVVDEGTEWRQTTIRIRENGIEEIIRSISEGGFVGVGTGRCTRLKNEIMFTFCMNVGRHAGEGGNGIKALGVDFFIPLSENEKSKYSKNEEVQQLENEVENGNEKENQQVEESKL